MTSLQRSACGTAAAVVSPVTALCVLCDRSHPQRWSRFSSDLWLQLSNMKTLPPPPPPPPPEGPSQR